MINKKGTGSKGKGEKQQKKTKEETHTLPFLPNQHHQRHSTLPPHPFGRLALSLTLDPLVCACVSVMRAVGAVSRD